MKKREEIKNEILKIIEDYSTYGCVREEDTFEDIKCDGQKYVIEITARVEEGLNLNIPDEDMDKWDTIKDIIDTVEKIKSYPKDQSEKELLLDFYKYLEFDGDGRRMLPNWSGTMVDRYLKSKKE